MIEVVKCKNVVLEFCINSINIILPEWRYIVVTERFETFRMLCVREYPMHYRWLGSDFLREE